jgi:ClpA/ClpB-like protein
MLGRLFREAYRASGELGHDWLGAEHLLVGLLETEVAGQALHTCGITREAVLTDISELPAKYQRKRLDGVEAGIRLETGEMKEVLDRRLPRCCEAASPRYWIRDQLGRSRDRPSTCQRDSQRNSYLLDR